VLVEIESETADGVVRLVIADAELLGQVWQERTVRDADPAKWRFSDA